MTADTLPLDGIDFEDETFRVSEDLDPVPLQESLREIGQLNPVMLLEGTGSRRVILTGFRRLRALRRLGARHCLARSMPGDTHRLQAFRIALWENLSHRTLNPLEQARALFTLKHTCGVSEETLVECYLQPLGLSSHKNVARSYLRLNTLNPEIRKYLAEGRITVASAERLSAMSRESQAVMASLFGRARFSASLQRQLLDLLDDLAAINSCGPAEIMARPEIDGVLDEKGRSHFQRGEAAFNILRRWRNPRLLQAEERFLARKKKLNLPGSVRVTPHPFFENPGVRFEFEAPTAEGFREIAGALHLAAGRAGLEELFLVE